MQSRRQFLQDLAFVAGATAGVNGGFLSAIQRAAAIEPTPGTSFQDAEHVVILMQENRSFDHSFGSLRGVRGFRDPRAITQKNGDPVWVQTAPSGEKFAPFRLDIKESKTTWMGDLPHGWADQTDAANKGLHDRWLEVKKSRNKSYEKMPLTMGHHTREDIPFYYALADAFTICDQNFCSTLTGTTPNRLHLWTGTCRTAQTPDSQAVVRNEDCSYQNWREWTTFPERLEDAGVSWKIYQNELTVPTGLGAEAASWLGNFGCSPLEWFTQYNVRLFTRHRKFLAQSAQTIPGEITTLEKSLPNLSGDEKEKATQRLQTLKNTLARTQKELDEYTQEKFEALSPREKSLHVRAFVTNDSDPQFRELEDLVYEDNGEKRELKVPRSDVLHQFRQDVQQGKLPTVSWLVPSGRFSDHPGYAWFGQWYLSEVLNILTSNPEVWKKTVFILTYDENDGYFDHVPPFQAPHPDRPETGRSSAGLPTELDFYEEGVDRKYKPNAALRDNSLGLGYRVPMIIASPWSRGGAVCSQVFDHTSVIQFVEKFAAHKSGKEILETNISPWRRTICGDLTSAFRKATDNSPGLEKFVERDPFIQQIYNARFKELPTGYHALTPDEIKQIRTNPGKSALPQQEPGTRPACPLPYELEVSGTLDPQNKAFVVTMATGNKRFGAASSGAPFIIYAETADGLQVRHYAVAAGQSLEECWPLADFKDGVYRLRVHGPNGFFREFSGGSQSLPPAIQLRSPTAPGKNEAADGTQLHVNIQNPDSHAEVKVVLKDHAYGNPLQQQTIAAGKTATLQVDLTRSSQWYDFSVITQGTNASESRYAGRFETGAWGTSDPAMA